MGLCCLVAVGGLAMCCRSSQASVKSMLVLSASPSPQANTLSQNSDVPWEPIVVWSKECRPRGEDSAEEKCLIFRSIILSWMTSPPVRTSDMTLLGVLPQNCTRGPV